MSDSQRLLERIEEALVAHGGDLGGWTLLADDALKIFDGRVTLRAEIHEADPPNESLVHAHVLATLSEFDDEVLDACMFGLGENREGALAEVSVLWLTGVAGPIKSFLDNKPVCMTCQAGVQGGDIEHGYSESDYGLPGLRAYVGPALCRGLDGEHMQNAINDRMPWFRYAAESAAPRRVHLAKATVTCKEKNQWSRQLEIDGHDVHHFDPDWPTTTRGPDFGYAIRFAVFEFPLNSRQVPDRAELERTIRHFAENLHKHESVDPLMQEMVRDGFDPDLVHQAESLSTIAFGRMVFESQGVQYSPTIIRARRDGRVEPDVPLMSLPAYSRARGLFPQLRESMSDDAFQALCLYNAESRAILQAMESIGEKIDLSGLTMYPSVVPDPDVSDQTMSAALALLQSRIDANRARKKKPWWRFWSS